ncbi:MAG: protein kinase [Candidatus Sericytochromatia bacterium]
MRESILIISNDKEKEKHLESFLIKSNYIVYHAEHGLKALKTINNTNISVILYDLSSEETAEYGFFEYLNKKHSSLKVIVTSKINNSDTIIKIMKNGAFDYIIEPINSDYLLDAIHKASSAKKEIENKIASDKKNREYQRVLIKEIDILKNELVSVKNNLQQRNLEVELIYGSDYIKEKSLSLLDVINNEKRIGKYTILEELGRGGMSVVYKAIDYTLNRQVAIKELTISQSPFPEEVIEDVTKRFIKEAQVIAMLRHDNIVKVFDVLEEKNKHYMVMEFIEGQTLDKLIAGNKSIPILESISIISEICLALDYIHSNNIIHRDVKPSNIIINHERNVKLMDFGVIRDKSVTTLTPTGAIVGTMAYTAPEQSSKKLDFKVDIFPLGTIFYELLTGVNPFEGKTYADTFVKIASLEPHPPSSINSLCDTQLDEIVMKAISKNANNRYTAKELYNALSLYISKYEISIA